LGVSAIQPGRIGNGPEDENETKKGYKLYDKELFRQVEWYARKVCKIAEKINFDVIHAHDWPTFKAAMAIKNKFGKPLVVHVHATEFDRTGGNGVNPHVYSIEKAGMEQADKICAVSNYTKNLVKEKYGIDESKIVVVHNGVEQETKNQQVNELIKEYNKIVLFLGRITLQKGPDYFIRAAKKVSEHFDNVKFVVAGSGDMEHYIIEESARLGIADKIIFTGFLRGDDVDYIYKMADVYVMPSVSEPFGISPLEAIKNNCPVIISKSSGVSEVINHCLKVDFWDIDQLANKIISVLKYDALGKEMVRNSSEEIRRISWDAAAEKCNNVYKTISRMGVKW